MTTTPLTPDASRLTQFARAERDRALARCSEKLARAIEHVVFVQRECQNFGFDLGPLDEKPLRAALDQCAHVYKQPPDDIA